MLAPLFMDFANGDAQAQQAQQIFQGAGGTDVRSYGYSG